MTYNEFIEIAAHYESVIKATKADILPIRSNSFVEFFDLINRQNAEIERYKENEKFIDAKCDSILEKLKTLNSEINEAIAKAESEAIKEFAKKINPIIDELVDIMFDGNESKCRISNCHKHSSIPCDSPTCIEENKAYWKLKIYNLVKEMVGDDNA